MIKPMHPHKYCVFTITPFKRFKTIECCDHNIMVPSKECVPGESFYGHVYHDYHEGSAYIKVICKVSRLGAKNNKFWHNRPSNVQLRMKISKQNSWEPN